MAVSDILTTMNHNIGVRCMFLSGILGEKHGAETACPNVVIARDYVSSPDGLHAMEYVRVPVNDGDVTFHAAHQALKSLIELFLKTAVDEMLAALGWIMTVDAEDFAAEDMKCRLRLLRRPGVLALLHEDMLY